MTRSAGKLGDNMARYQWSFLAPILRKLNPTNPAAVDLISRPDWGPSKGLDGDYIKWIGLLWPGRNLVRVSEIVDGWGRVDGSPLYTSDTLTANDNPDLVHMVYDFNRANGYGERAKPVYVPIFGGPWWVDMTNLVRVNSLLPKAVRATALPWINVRAGVGIASAIVGKRVFGTSFLVYEVRVGSGGLWGRVDGGWIALRYNGKNLTDWKI
jgi:hypothetical protein